MNEQAYSIPIVWRLHKDLWDKNRKSLEHQMKAAKEKLVLDEQVKIDHPEPILVVGVVGSLADSE